MLKHWQNYNITSEGPALKLKHPVGVLQSLAMQPLMLVSRDNNCTKRQRSRHRRWNHHWNHCFVCSDHMILSEFLETSANTHFITPFDRNIIRRVLNCHKLREEDETRWQSQIRSCETEWQWELCLNLLLGGGFYPNWKMQRGVNMKGIVDLVETCWNHQLGYSATANEINSKLQEFLHGVAPRDTQVNLENSMSHLDLKWIPLTRIRHSIQGARNTTTLWCCSFCSTLGDYAQRIPPLWPISMHKSWWPLICKHKHSKNLSYWFVS